MRSADEDVHVYGSSSEDQEDCWCHVGIFVHFRNQPRNKNSRHTNLSIRLKVSQGGRRLYLLMLSSRSEPVSNPAGRLA